MRKELLLCLLAFLAVQPYVGAQQRPHYTQYIINNYLLNPAIAGIENYTDVKLGHRRQWQGFQDAPVTTYLTIHTPIGKKDDRTTATSFEMEGENPRGKAYWQSYTAAEPHHGIGLKIIHDKTGPLSHFSAYGSYAYHLGISPKTSISAGVDVGLMRQGLDATRLDFGPANPVDPAVGRASEITRTRPDLGAGIWVYSADFFIGAAAQQIIPQKLTFADSVSAHTNASLVPHSFFSAGYRFFLSDDVSAMPSVMVKYIHPVPLQTDANIKFQYRDLLWAGAGFRFRDGFSGMLGVNISNTFNVSYAYDHTSSSLNRYSRGTHELVLGFLIGNRYGDWCPRNVW